MRDRINVAETLDHTAPAELLARRWTERQTYFSGKTLPPRLIASWVRQADRTLALHWSRQARGLKETSR
jgi:hypothetical protein